MTPIHLVQEAARAAADKKANEVVILAVQELLSITDHFVICSGTSDRHVRTVADEVVVRLKRRGVAPLRKEGTDEGRWILLDYDDFVVHVFLDADREFYDLERLWKDAPRVPVEAVEEFAG